MSTLKLYSPFPVEVSKGRGIYIYSKDGKEYTDTFSGIGVLSFGHSYEPLLNKIKNKMDRYMHMSNYFKDEDLDILSDKLVEATGKDGKVFFTNSGTESTEAALKAVKKIATERKNKIIYFTKAFHGRTLGALSLNGFKSLKEPFLPLLPDTVELMFNDAELFEDYMTRYGKQVAAVFLEPVQGSGGIVPVSLDFADAVMKYRKIFKYITVMDEIQAGLGRTGHIYSYQNFNLEPDIITAGKALGGGLPLGAAIFLGETSEILKGADHGSTFAPNPVALAGGRFLMEHLPELLEDVSKKGLYFKELLGNITSSKIIEVRGTGLMIGVVLDKAYPELKDKAFKEENLLLNFVGNNSIIRLLPPLNIEYKEIDIIVEKIRNLLMS
ncbi:MAG: aminotransferase class III-fold pyridoxal phosphate-dependent enzyme [Candidatus Eremiobacterota bacterium]